jgi:hypothetical protein
MDKLQDFYHFALISDQLAKVDSMVRKASTWLSIALESAKLMDFEDDAARSVLPLNVAIQEKLVKAETFYPCYHPVQFAARSLGKKVVEILNAFSSDSKIFSGMVYDKRLSSLQVSLDSKPSYIPTEISIYGSRRLLEKAIRLVKDAVTNKDTADRVFVGRITGITSAWSVRVGLDKGLVIAPHASSIRNVSPAPASRLSKLSSQSSSSIL